MKLSREHLLELSERAIHAACEAGALIAQNAGRAVAVQTKADAPSRASEVLTEVDLMSQDTILKILQPLCATYDLALLSEESPDDSARLEKDAFWCIDPMDGTLCFVEQTPGYSVSIGLTSRAGEPLIGVVFDAVDQVLYHAVAGVGTFRNHEPWKNERPITRDRLPLLLISDSGFADHPQLKEIMNGLERIAEELGCSGVEAQFLGGAAMNACWVMERPNACYFKFPKPDKGGGSLWDYAATACIAQEFGAPATDSFGAPLDLNRPDSTYMNHRGMIYASDPQLAEKLVGLREKLYPQH
ncbi:MAG: hypothetical protein JXR40_12465 [Pontiellaceae bacterium]|nr:hypothetical protein [Pontiellaceae bacterium]